MSYRSDVGIMCKEKAYNMLKETWEKHTFEPDEIVKTDDTTYFFEYRSVKWYEGYPEIDAITGTLDELDKLHDIESYESDGYEYKMYRLGEEETDVECRCNGYDLDFYISFDIGEVKEKIKAS